MKKSKSKKNTGKSRSHTIKNKKSTHHFGKLSPQTLLNLFSKKKVAIVNTLDENIVINTHPTATHCCYGSSFIKKSCNELKQFEVIVLYCANNTCSASHTYGNKLVKKCSALKNKIVLYEGGVYEWALLSFSFPETYAFYDLKYKKQLDKKDVESYFVKMNHRKETTKTTSYPKIILNNQERHKSYDFNEMSSSLNDSLKNKVCVVTGGTSGLGLEVVKKMLDCGAKHVTLTYYHNTSRANRVKELLEKTYGKQRFYVLKADARTKEGNLLTFDRKTRLSKLKLNVGPIDCVDINAGIFGPANMHKKHIFNISEKDYDKTMATNLTGYFLGFKYFTKQAIENEVKDAAIVCIKSIYGSTGSLFSNTAYQTSKHGVLGLVHQTAIELARPNPQLKIKYPIRVNAVSPTFTNTALTKPFLDKSMIHKTIKNDNPTNQLANKRDVAEAVIFLLSDKAHSITGVDLPVDCGVLAESIPTYKEVEKLNKAGIEELSCCGENI